MLYAIAENYFIDVADIAHIRCEDSPNGSTTHPYRMFIRTKDGQQYGVKYSSKRQCQHDILDIVNTRNRLLAKPVTQFELEQTVMTEIERLKRYIHKQFTDYIKKEDELNEKT